MENALKNAENFDVNVQNYENQVQLMHQQQEMLEKQRTDDQHRIDQLEKENKIMTDNLLKIAKSNKVGGGNDKLQEDYNSSTSKKNEEQKQQHGHELIKSKSGNNIIINPTAPRTLTKKMMREIIDEIYESKVNYDKYCEESKIQYETLEQHMYTFLNHKYGLKVMQLQLS